MKAPAIVLLLNLAANLPLQGEAVHVRSTADASAPPRACAEAISPDTGTPVAIPWPGPLWWGVSTRPTAPGQEPLALLWPYNATDKPQAVMTCSDIDAFWISAIDVFDAQGRRVPSRTEEERKNWRPIGNLTWKERPRLEMCTRDFPIEIPAHSCRHGIFSKMEYDFSRDLRRYYVLSAGRYVLVPAEDGPGGVPAMRTVIAPKNGVEVIVLEK